MPSYYVRSNKVFEGYTFANLWTLNAASITDAAAEAPHIANFEAALLIQPVQITTLIVSPIPDQLSQFFITVDYNQSGDLNGNASDMAAMDIVLWVNLSAATGRPGKKFVRGALFRTDVTVDGALLKATIEQTFKTRVANAWGILQGQLEQDGQYLECGKTHGKAVTSVEYKGVTTNKPAHKWFNRGHAAP